MTAAQPVQATTLGDLLGDLLGARAGAHASTSIRDLVLDSRAARAGAAFVALRGACDHGLRHAEDALGRGAEVVLYDPADLGAETLSPRVAARAVEVPELAARAGSLAHKLYGPAMGHVELAGVTGTNGKTTVAWLVARAMAAAGRRCGYIGTLGHGLPPDVTPHALTTPDCFTLHRELAALAADGGTHASLEVSSHALAQDRIAGLEIRTASFTNLTRDHLDAHGSLEAYGAAKARLFEREGVRRAVLNANDPFAGRLAERLARGVMPIRVGVIGEDRIRRRGGGASRRTAASTVAREQAIPDGDADLDGARELDIAARVRSHGLAGLELELSGRFGDARLRSPLLGTFNAENLLVALGVLVAWDLSLADACTALSGCTAPPGRLEAVGAGRLGSAEAPAVPSGVAGEAGTADVVSARALHAPTDGTPYVVVDYAHTPDGLDRVLGTLRALADGELWCVLGCGGERDRGKRAPMGAIAAEWADHIVVTDDNPRGEDPRAIVREILAGVGTHPDAVVEHDRAAAIRRAIHAARAGDVVLIAGKGHETTQRIGADERPFSDRDVALAVLAELASSEEPAAPKERR